ncbi:Palmitoyltransferase zdhhc15 [Perkinsus chesapeaki]|uniref:Palmitoyltransferase n=1 Tax=Perkinsus chesapeaki TaxID=330153 RepID=A0A7J6LPP9_PERCH|nr:Palmitoyltransferase zdhhc15 [Perkinsus chesapeaki]
MLSNSLAANGGTTSTRLPRIPQAIEGRPPKQSPHFKFVLAVIGVIAFIYCGFVFGLWWPALGGRWSRLMMLIFNTFVCLMLLAFFQSCTTDPGGVPQYWGFHIGDDAKRRRYCKMCHVWKPERCHHCSACNRCNLNMDHHCPWLNNCVGFYNRKFFIQLLVYVYICIALVLLFGFPRVIAILDERLNHESGLILMHPRSCLGLFSYGLSILLAISLFNFVKFHLGLVADNFTTIENFDREPGVRSKYDIGRRANVEEVMGPTPWLWWLPFHTRLSEPVGDGVNWRIRTSDGGIGMSATSSINAGSKSTTVAHPVTSVSSATDAGRAPDWAMRE